MAATTTGEPTTSLLLFKIDTFINRKYSASSEHPRPARPHAEVVGHLLLLLLLFTTCHFLLLLPE
jgi:hypothetical protein